MLLCLVREEIDLAAQSLGQTQLGQQYHDMLTTSFRLLPMGPTAYIKELVTVSSEEKRYGSPHRRPPPSHTPPPLGVTLHSTLTPHISLQIVSCAWDGALCYGSAGWWPGYREKWMGSRWTNI